MNGDRLETLALLFAALAAMAIQKHPKRQGTTKNQILETGPAHPILDKYTWWHDFNID